MARPKKESLDYFPMNCVDDMGIRILEANYGAVGFAGVVKLFQLIYGTKGYYAEWNEETTILMARELGCNVATVEGIVGEAITRNIFSGEMYERYGILTSRQIQDIYITAVMQRTSTNLNSNFLLLDYDELPDNVRVDGVFCKKTRVFCEKNPAEVEFSGMKSTQSKVNKSKVNESKGEESKVKDVTLMTNDDPVTYHYDYESGPSSVAESPTPSLDAFPGGAERQSISDDFSSPAKTDHYDYEEERTKKDHGNEEYDDYGQRTDPYILFKEKRERDQKIYEENLKRMSSAEAGYAYTSRGVAEVPQDPVTESSPDIDGVKKYAKEEGLFYVDCEWFVTYYSSRGWENVKDWRSALRRWNEKDKVRTKEVLGRADLPDYTKYDEERDMMKYLAEFYAKYGED